MADCPEHGESIRAWLTKPQGMVLFSGPTGTGKTRLAYACFRYYLYNWKKAFFWHIPDLCVRLQLVFNNTAYGGLTEKLSRTPELLILDDLGPEKSTDYILQELYRIISHREEWGYPTIITSNLSLNEIAQKLSDRIASRLAGGLVLIFGGDDHRIALPKLPHNPNALFEQDPKGKLPF